MELEKIDELLEKSTGTDFIQAERQARLLGDSTPSIVFSVKFQAILLANLLGVPVEDVEELPMQKFVTAIGKVNAFLFGQAAAVAEK